ncbi:MAG: hypothetical protein RI907_1115 [Pseudomonadota bacterium]
MPLVLQYSTLGVWAQAPLGLSARLGVALPYKNGLSWVAGGEFGSKGSKQFVGWRSDFTPSGYGWGTFELARWQTRQEPLLSDAHTTYYGGEAQIAFLRAGLMFPQGAFHHPKLTLGIGVSY